MLNLKKKNMEEKVEKTLSRGELMMKKQMPEIEQNLSNLVPQARLIKHGHSVMDFDVEITPDTDSFWYGGKYIFSFTIPEDYNFSPPKVMCKTKIYHPNIDYNGNVCLNILKEAWEPTLTALNCIGAIYFLFTEPNPEDPLNHDVAKIMRDNIEEFKQNVKRTLKGGYQYGQDFPRFIKY